METPQRPQDNFSLPSQRNPKFTGREDFLQTVQDKLAISIPGHFNYRIALYGMGGIGKTQCALEYVYRNKTGYQKIYWLSAVDQASLLSDYRTVAKKAGLRELETEKPFEIAKAVLEWLEQEPSWLIVIDNLDDIKVANDLLPETGPGKHILITTRNPHTIGIPAEPLEVPLFDKSDAINLLSTLSDIPISSPVSEKKAREIVEELGNLPLAIAQAAAYVREVSRDFTVYHEEYIQNRKELHKWMPMGNVKYPYSVATTWSMSFHFLQSNHPPAARLLQLFSFLNPDGILIEFLLAGADALEVDLQQILASQIEMAKVLLELEKLSLIKWDREEKSITIHRLIQTVVRDGMSNDEQPLAVNTVIGLFLNAFPSETTNDTRFLCRRYQGQVVEPLSRIKTLYSRESASIKMLIGRFLRDDGKYNDSERILLQAVKICTVLSGSSGSDTLTSMEDLALTYRLQHRTMEAAKLEETVLENRRTTLGEGHPDTLTTMNNLALIYWQQGSTTEAAKLGEEVLEKRRRILGEEHPDTLMTMHNLASTYVQQGRMTESAKLGEEVFNKRRAILGEEHPDTLMTMDNLALTYARQGRTTEAANLGMEALEKYRRILGDEHPDTLITMANLALTYRKQGRMTEAAELEAVFRKTKASQFE